MKMKFSEWPESRDGTQFGRLMLLLTETTRRSRVDVELHGEERTGNHLT